MPINVLIVDDSAVIRSLMQKALAEDSSIVVIGTAANGKIAIEMAERKKPDIIILDIEMPVMDGITALPGIIKASPSSKIIMASTLTNRNAEISLKALSMGATDYLPKPSAKFGNDIQIFYRELIAKVKALASQPSSTKTTSAKPDIVNSATQSYIRPSATTPLHVSGVKALAIASSTGGPQALIKVFGDIKGKLKSIPIFITQHMPPSFTTILAGHISKAGERDCYEATEGMAVKPGCAYIAPGDFHMVPKKTVPGDVVISLNQDQPENFCRPSADPMLRALSSIYGNKLVALVLTGMGSDGLPGAKIVVGNGGSIIAQNEESCVVYGMPKAVADEDICRAILPLSEIGKYLINQIEGK